MEDHSPDNGVAQRRELIKLTPLPHPRHDAVVTLTTVRNGISVRLRYVPDRDVIAPKSLETYLESAFRSVDGPLLAKAQTVLEDINDQAIPCWLEILLVQTDSGLEEKACVEEKQPRWQDPGILARLEP